MAQRKQDKDFRDEGARNAAVQADERDARHASGADRMPTPEEEQAAERAKLPAGAGAAYKEALERGASQQGEGRVE